MIPQQWFRFDTDFYLNPKIVRLMGRKDGGRLVVVWAASIGYSHRYGTDGLIEPHALPLIHGRTTDARVLVDERLWDVVPAGWLVHDFPEYQPLRELSDEARAQKTKAGSKGSCVRWHGKECGCWDR